MSIKVPGFTRKDSADDRFYEWQGTLYPSVTTILKYGLPKPAIAKWETKLIATTAAEERVTLAGMTKKAATEYLLGLAEASSLGKANVGTEVHAYAESAAFGKPAPEPTEEAKPFVDQFHNFLYDFAPEFIAVELTVFSHIYGYAGTADIYAVINGKVCILDIKTGKRIWPEVALQCSAYAHSDFAVAKSVMAASPSPIVERGYVLHLSPTGYELRRLDIGDTQFNAFLAALDLYKWSREDAQYSVGGIIDVPA